MQITQHVRKEHTHKKTLFYFLTTYLMAKTDKGQKYNRIPGYTKADGTKVKGHARSNPYTSDGEKKSGTNRKRK